MFAAPRLPIVSAPPLARRYRLRHRSPRVRNRQRPVVSSWPQARRLRALLRFHRIRPPHRSVRLPLLFSLLASEISSHATSGLQDCVVRARSWGAQAASQLLSAACRRLPRVGAGSLCSPEIQTRERRRPELREYFTGFRLGSILVMPAPLFTSMI